MIPIAFQLGAAVALTIAAFGSGWKTHDWKVTAGLVEARDVALAALQAKQKDYNAASDQLERFRTENQKLREQSTTEVERIVQNPVYIRECFDDDGMRALYSAIDKRPINPAKPASGVPGANKTSK